MWVINWLLAASSSCFVQDISSILHPWHSQRIDIHLVIGRHALCLSAEISLDSNWQGLSMSWEYIKFLNLHQLSSAQILSPPRERPAEDLHYDSMTNLYQVVDTDDPFAKYLSRTISNGLGVLKDYIVLLCRPGNLVITLNSSNLWQVTLSLKSRKIKLIKNEGSVSNLGFWPRYCWLGSIKDTEQSINLALWVYLSEVYFIVRLWR